MAGGWWSGAAPQLWDHRSLRKPNTVAIVGGETLVGREVRDLLEQQAEPVRVRLLSTEEEGTQVVMQGEDEPILMTPLEEGALTDAAVVMLTGTPESSRAVRDALARGAHPAVLIDLSYAFDEQAVGRLRAPLLEPAGFAVEAGAVQVIAHPAATSLALVLTRLARRFPYRRAVVQVYEPASERGRPGLNELQQQAVSLLSFQPLKKEVFDAQLGFSMLARYGLDAPQPLAEVELRVDRHLATLLSLQGAMPMPSLRLVQAPVFHGHSFSLWIEFEQNPGATAVAEALASAQIDVRPNDEDAPTNVGVAGQSGVTMGLIEPDRNAPQALWLWAVSDNVRVAAESAVEVARPWLSA